MVDTTDILRKAAEDVQQGMWCKDEWYAGYPGLLYSPLNLALDTALSSKRCAEGSIAVATMLLGGDEMDLEDARNAVARNIPYCGHGVGPAPIPHFNDEHLPDDPFEAGQQLAELFRQTADSL